MALLAIISTVAACAAIGVRCTADDASAVIGLASGRDVPLDMASAVGEPDVPCSTLDSLISTSDYSCNFSSPRRPRRRSRCSSTRS